MRTPIPIQSGALGGARLSPSPTARQLATRRRMAVVICALALGLAAGAVGVFAPSHGPAGPGAATGPFSYFPT